MQRIVVSVTNDLVTDQRVHKICSTLVEMDFSVLLIGRKLLKNNLLERNYDTHRMKLLFNKGFLFYAEYNLRLFFKLFFLKKNILLSNDLDTLLPNFLISKLQKKKLVFDSHELFTEVPELINRPRVQNFWLNLEKAIVPKLKNCYTVSNSIANYYKETYNSNFEVIINTPYKSNNIAGKFSFHASNKKIILYQGAVNLSRGIELMIEAMQYIDDAFFIIIGDGDLLNEMKGKVNTLNLNNKVKFLDRMSPLVLQKLTPLADIGISLEEDRGLNYRYALPNKLFDYIQAIIPVLVSDFPEMRKVVEGYNVGEILYERSPKNLAKLITEMFKKGKEFWKEPLSKAANELIWEKESIKLKNIFNNFK